MKLISFHKHTDKELVKSCLENNRIAQKKLFDSYKDAMYTTAFRMLGNEHDASDVLQETFIDVFENLSGFRFESTLGAWIKVILVRIALRKLKFQNDFQDLTDAEQLPNDGWNMDFTADDLDKAIQSLPDSARAVFFGYFSNATVWAFPENSFRADEGFHAFQTFDPRLSLGFQRRFNNWSYFDVFTTVNRTYGLYYWDLGFRLGLAWGK